MKTAISSYSFDYLMKNCGETQLSVIKKAKEFGFDGIEFTDLCPPEKVTQKEYAKMIKEEASNGGCSHEESQNYRHPEGLLCRFDESV